ncbi:CBS domain-containing protein, partial [Thermodesulfobacteriota bacterium]
IYHQDSNSSNGPVNGGRPIKDIMTPSPYTISASETVRKAKLFMVKHSIRHLPVVSKGKLVGILTDRDIKLLQAVSKDENFDDKHCVGGLCLHDVYIVPGSTRADKVLAYMATKRIGSALITGNQKLIGIFTVTDVCRSFSEYLCSESGVADTDEDSLAI